MYYKSQDRSKKGALHRTQRDTNGAKSIDDNDGYEVLFMASNTLVKEQSIEVVFGPILGGCLRPHFNFFST